MNEIEIWKDIQGYENYYQVSNLGRVKNVPHYEGLSRNLDITNWLMKNNFVTANNNHFNTQLLCIIL